MNSWIIPCNLKFYDVINHLNQSNTIVWKKGVAAKNGDLVYLYIGVPYKSILYKCEVLEDQLIEEDIQNDKYAIVSGSVSNTYMKLQVIERWNKGVSLADLKGYGLVLIRKQSRLSGKVLNFVSNYSE